MAKRKTKQSKIIDLILLIVIVVGIVMIALPALIVDENTLNLEIKGYEAIFGYTIGNTKYLEFSFLALIPYLLLLIAFILVGYTFVGKQKKGKSIFLVVLVLTAGAGIMLIMGGKLVSVSSNTPLSLLLNISNTEFSEIVNLGIGSIIAIVASFGAAGLSLVKMLTK